MLQYLRNMAEGHRPVNVQAQRLFGKYEQRYYFPKVLRFTELLDPVRIAPPMDRTPDDLSLQKLSLKTKRQYVFVCAI
ncbi:MAG: hypothetical protein M0036_22715 [Desulfobacteraceae bacterium]|nr:hypothetical protein [Desulfobacteraceae bacterium]